MVKNYIFIDSDEKSGHFWTFNRFNDVIIIPKCGKLQFADYTCNDRFVERKGGSDFASRMSALDDFERELVKVKNAVSLYGDDYIYLVACHFEDVLIRGGRYCPKFRTGLVPVDRMMKNYRRLSSVVPVIFAGNERNAELIAYDFMCKQVDESFAEEWNNGIDQVASYFEEKVKHISKN